jgi:hypothetical protein
LPADGVPRPLSAEKGESRFCDVLTC